MTITQIVQKIHRKFAKDTDYPESSSEDLLVYLDHIDDAISEWESCVREGINWKELLVPAYSFVFGGTGEDSLPADFLCFGNKFDQTQGVSPAQIMVGSNIYSEVKSAEGEQAKQQELVPYYFWTAGGKVYSLPAITGTISLPYLKKATRYTTGDETDEPEMEDQKFIEDFALAKIFLDNADDVLYEAYMTSAVERLKRMKYNALT